MGANGRECLEVIPWLCPDVITLDLDMPVMNGITTIKNIMIQHQIPIVVVSSLIQDGYFAFEVLRLGVMDFVPKPSRIAGHNRAEEEELIRMRVLAASGMEVNRMRRLKRVSRGDGFRGNAERLPRVLAAIGTTLAGPNTVMRIITQLSPGFPGSIIALQELHPKILEPFCSHLNRISPLEVIPVTRPCALEPGKVYMCSTSLGVQLSRSPHEPEAIMVDTADSSTSPIDQLFESVARCFHQSSCGVLLTGVGEDGARGLGIIKEKGGLTIVQKQECCIYPNLVDHALKEGVVDLIIPDCQMADQLHILAGVDSGPCR
jgi:two-component system chemotaxis response regulator CheB